MVLRRSLSLVTLPFVLVALLGFTSCADGTSVVSQTSGDTQVPPPPSGGADRDIIAGGDSAPDRGGKDKGDSNGSGTTEEAGTAATDLGGPDAPGPGEPVPEPGTMLLVGSGLAGAALLGRRRRRLEVQTES